MPPAERPPDVISPPPSEASTKVGSAGSPTPLSAADPGSKSPTYVTPPLIKTDIKPVRYSLDAATPQAQNLQEILGDAARLRSSSSSSLERKLEQGQFRTRPLSRNAVIPEIREVETDTEDHQGGDTDATLSPPIGEYTEVRALRMALEECWTLCNTLASLSSIHRVRVFNSSGTPDAHEKAWKSCWKLCQKLYHSRDESAESFNVRTNLDLCRDFCQSLFDVRQRKDEIADSILRVSFELNNQ